MKALRGLILLAFLPMLGASEGQYDLGSRSFYQGASGSSIAVVGSVGTGRDFSGTLTSVTTGDGSGATAFSCAAGDTAAVAFTSVGSALSSGNPTVSDSASNSGWTAGPTQYTAFTIWWFYNLNLSSPITSATVSFPSSGIVGMVAAYCISGTHNFDSTMGQVNLQQGSSTTFTTGTFTTSHAAEIVLTFTQNGGELMSSATAPAVLGANYTNSGYISTLSTIYSSIQTGVTMQGTYASAGSWASSTIGFY